MKRLLLPILVLTLIFFQQSGCKKNKEPETVTINGLTFSCKVDGKQFIPDYWDYGNNIAPLRLKFIANTNNAIDMMLIAEKQNEYVEIYLNYPLVQGKHELKFYTKPFPIYDPPKDNGIYVVKYPHQEYITNDTMGGYVDLIEIDTIHLKIYGKFEFTGTDRLTNKQIKVTNGIFKNY